MANLKILKLIDRKAELEAELEELKSKFESIPIEIQDNIDKLNASKLKLYKNGKRLDWRENIEACLGGKPYSRKAAANFDELIDHIYKMVKTKYFDRKTLPIECFNNGDRNDFSDEYRQVLSNIIKEQSNVVLLVHKIDSAYDYLSSLPKYVEQVSKRIDKQNEKIANARSVNTSELPEALKKLKNMYADLLFDSYVKSREFITKLRKQYTNDDEFYKEISDRKISSNVLRFMNKPDTVLKEAAEDEAMILVISMYERCLPYTGKINEFKYSSIAANGELNGLAIGEAGNAVVRTIVAGGYNIQCLHYRVLVIPRK